MIRSPRTKNVLGKVCSDYTLGHMKRFKHDVGYIAPSRNEVIKRFEQLEFTTPYSLELVQDLACAASTYSALGHLLPREFDSTEYPISEDFSLDQAIAYHQNIQHFIAGLDWDIYPGNTPLAKAASVVQAFAKEMEDNSLDQEGTEESDIPAIPLFMKSKTEIQQKTKEIETVIQTIEASSEVVNSFLGPGNSCSKLARMDEKQLVVIKHLAILGSKGKIKSRKTSPIQKIEQMTEMTQVSKLSNVSSMLMPTFGYKLASNQLTVKTPKQSGKQLLVLAIDASSSMTQTGKQEWVKAIILNRLDAVAKGEAKLIICWFENSIYESHISYIETKQQAVEFAKTMRIHCGGGATNVAHVIEQITCRIDNNLFKIEGENPQIVVMNDGQDTVNPFLLKYTTNAFILGQDNEGFKSLIVSNGGHYERFL